MALTPAEKQELLQLEAWEREQNEKQNGTKAVAQVQTRQRQAPPDRPRPFSIYRSTVGALRDAAQGVLDTIDDAGDYLGRKTGIGGIALGKQARNGIIEYQNFNTFNKRGGDILFGGDGPQKNGQRGNAQLPTLEGEERAGTAEKLVRGIGSFLVPYVGWAKAVGVARGASWLGRAGRATVAGAAVDFTQVDPVSGNMANFLRDGFGINSKTLDALASEEDEDRLFSRFKAAAVGAPVGIAADAFFEAGFKALKAYRAWKGTADEAAEIVKSLKDMPLKDSVRKPQAAPEAAAKPAAKTETVTADATTTVRKTPTISDKPENLEDVLAVLQRKAGTTGEEFPKLVDELLRDPENAAAKLGINPSELDFTKFDDPDTLGKFLTDLGETLAQGVASKLGRTTLRISEKATLRAARAFATTADVLKDVNGATENLAEYLTGARLFVGAHAHKLMSLADEALKEITTAGPGQAWNAFLEAFHRHAYYQATVRGASSEVGRALRSLQIVAKVNPKKAGKTLTKALEADVKEKIVGEVEQGASAYADLLVTDADKIAALTKLKELGGDVGDLTRHVREGNMGLFRRVDAALRETVGNLFSIGTASYNVLAGSAMLGSRALSKGLAAVGRMALSPLGGKNSMNARIAMVDTWAYTDGILSGFREAVDATLRVLEKEGLAEARLNLDSMGLKGLAKKAAVREAQAADAIAGHSYERTDVRNHRAFAVTTAGQQVLNEKIAQLSGPEFWKTGLTAAARVLSSGVNALGSLSRAGTILFINLPDQFVGTLATRAGAYSKAVRLAGTEAAELGLEGKELTQYLKARTVQLTEGMPIGAADDPFNAGAAHAIASHGDAEAREVLFQDDVELGINQFIERGLSQTPMMHLFVPFVKTPLRILERTAIDYTPLGLLKDRVRQAIVAGGPEGDEALARITLGSLAVFTAYQLAEDRTIVGNDGGYGSSARLSRPSYSLRIGDDQFEFNRIDPMGSLLGFGADLHQYFRSNEDDPEAPGILSQATEALLWATTANILSKTWLTSLRNLTDLAGATSDEDFSVRLSKFVGGFATRFTPASGLQRTTEKVSDDFLREAFTFSDQLLKGSLGAEKLPVKRDRILGRPVPYEGWDRIIGVRAGPGADDGDDPLAAELERLSFDIPAPKRKVEGVKLNATQFSRLLELRGQIVKSPQTGLTLEETLSELIKLPEYQDMNRQARIQAMRDEMDGFTRLATDELLREDNDFAYRALRKETFDATFLNGGNREQADAETRRLGKELGLTPVD